MIWFAVVVIWIVNFVWIFFDTVRKPQDHQSKKYSQRIEHPIAHFQTVEVFSDALVPVPDSIQLGTRRN